MRTFASLMMTPSPPLFWYSGCRGVGWDTPPWTLVLNATVICTHYQIEVFVMYNNFRISTNNILKLSSKLDTCLLLFANESLNFKIQNVQKNHIILIYFGEEWIIEWFSRFLRDLFGAGDLNIFVCLFYEFIELI